MPEAEFFSGFSTRQVPQRMTPRGADDAQDGGPAGPRMVYVTESDDYSKTVRGIDIKAVRVAGETMPTEIQSSVTPGWVATSMKIGFSVLSRTTLPDDQIGVGVIEYAPRGARWCGIDLEGGDVVVYGPEAAHTAVNPAGMRFSFAVMSTEDLARTSDSLHVDSEVPRGSVVKMPPSVATRRVRALVSDLPGRSMGADVVPALRRPDLFAAMSDVLTSADLDRSVSRRLSDTRIVLACIEYADRAQRIPSMVELGEAAHASERRVRTAFRLTHDLAPHSFFLNWGLDLARRRLLASDAKAVTVAWVACGAGFTHLGRFARYYKQQYGESPSVTLRRDRWDARA